MGKEQIISKLMRLGRLSGPTMYTYSNAKQMPHGEYGYCVLSIADHTFYISAVEGAAMEIGDLLYAIPISEMKNIRHSPRITLNPYLKFTWQGADVVVGAVTADMKKALGIAK